MATSGSVQLPSAWKCVNNTSTSTKSTNVRANDAIASTANDMRYCNWLRTRAPTRCRHVSQPSRAAMLIVSPPLDDDAAGRDAENETADREQRNGPRELERERTREAGARVSTEEHVDRDLDHRRERKCGHQPLRPLREQRQRQDESRQQRDAQRRQRVEAAEVEDPERREIDEPPPAEAHDDGERDTDCERRPLADRGRQLHMVEDGTDEARRNP